MASKVKVTTDWDAIKADPVEFTTKLLTNPDGSPATPHPAQVEIMRHPARVLTIDTGRQFGKSIMMGWIATYLGVIHPHWDIFVIAPSLEQSRIIFSEIECNFRQAPLKYLVVGKPKQYPFPEIRLSNGARFTARGANSPQYIRGNHPHVIINDEAAFIKDNTLTDVIEPSMLVTGREPGATQINISTPFGAGAFKDYYDEGVTLNNEEARSYHYTSYDNPYADRKQLERVKARYGEDSLLWRSEYLGIFDTGDRAVFPWADIRFATEHWTGLDPDTHEVIFPQKPQPGHHYVQGVDLANLRDYFVSAVLDTHDQSAITLARLDRFNRKGYTYAKNTVRANYQTYHRARTLVDATSLGESVVEDLGDIHAQGYKFTEQSKWEIVQNLARMLSEHRLVLPPDRDIIHELQYFEYTITAAKHMKMEAAKGHDDIVMGLALAGHLANLPLHLGTVASVDLLPTRSGPRPRRPPPGSQPDRDPFAMLFE